MSADIVNMVTPAIIGCSLSVIASLLHYVTSNKANKSESIQINEEVQEIKEIVRKENNSILDLMYKNVLELREYYVISKRQANSSFYAFLIACFFGAIIYIMGIIISRRNYYNIIYSCRFDCRNNIRIVFLDI